MKPLLTILLLSFCTVASACESYEECIEIIKSSSQHSICTDSFDNKPVPCSSKERYFGYNTESEKLVEVSLKAIAYKLDEISKKLDKLPKSDQAKLDEYVEIDQKRFK